MTRARSGARQPVPFLACGLADRGVGVGKGVVELGEGDAGVLLLVGVAERHPELQQFLGGMVRATITNHEDIFLQRQHGLVEDAAYRAWLSQVTATWSNPAFRAGWRLQRPAAGADFAAFLDKLIAETPVRPARSAERLVAEWKSAWDEVTRASP